MGSGEEGEDCAITVTRIAALVRALCAWVRGATPGARRLVSGVALSQEQPSPEGMKRWMDSMKPGPQHEVLERMAGSWSSSMRMRWGRDLPWVESKGTEERALVWKDETP